MFKIPGDDKISEDLSEERTTATEQVAAEPSTSNDGPKTELFNQKDDSEQTDNRDTTATLKAFLDSYEEFVDEYLVFMKKYMADPTNAVSMLTEYSEIMGKYADFAEKVDQYDSKEMSTEDAKYYLEVTTRCTQKMLDIYSD